VLKLITGLDDVVNIVSAEINGFKTIGAEIEGSITLSLLVSHE